MVEGYKIKNPNKNIRHTAICNDCINKTGFNIHKLKAKKEKTELDTKKFASEFCIVCNKDITRGDKNTKRDYPAEIIILFRKQFCDKHVYPLRDNRGQRKEVSKGVTVSESITTPYDPIVFDVEDEKLADEISTFIDKLSKLGPIRGKRKDITDYEVNIYEFMIWYNN